MTGDPTAAGPGTAEPSLGAPATASDTIPAGEAVPAAAFPAPESTADPTADPGSRAGNAGPPATGEPSPGVARDEGSRVAIGDDGWPLDESESRSAPVEPPPAQPPPLPSPAAAAYEAARIVGEMVGDINSVPGAALVAAAAAGAAIEVARARVAAGEPDRPLAAPPDPAGADPVITVRMQRERILRALAEDIGANATSTATAESAAAASATAGIPATSEQVSSQPGIPLTARGEPSRAPSHGGRATTQPGRAATQPPRMEDAASADDAFDEGMDPVAIA
ncbi:MAG TPA: hypothetical protein VHN14_11070, partial [Kofleriaceae bacterium]|nr:hypothetical protein [Kofleriaceae bacterium]